MATVATYGGQHRHMSSISSMSSSTTTSTIHQQQQQVDDEQFTTLFCRALYDYTAQDASALSFRRDDIIEVLTQQPSGWWDGLLADERGWFPSNYVTVISDEEAELAFSGSDFSNQDSVVDISSALMNQADNEQWLQSEAPNEQFASNNDSTQMSDFWIPEVSSDGQISYVNTLTGQRSRDLPQENTDDSAGEDLAGLTSQSSSSRSGTSAGLGFTGSDAVAQPASAGFGLPKRTTTPEPWDKKLADDGLSYYYVNRVTGDRQWTRPKSDVPAPVTAIRLQPKPPVTIPAAVVEPIVRVPSETSHSSPRSVYSDDSEIHPLGHPSTRSKDGSPPRHPINGTSDTPEGIAHQLQQSLAPSPPELIFDLSASAQRAIQAVISNIQFLGSQRRQGDEQMMDTLVRTVVITVRNLLYVAAAPMGHIPSSVMPKGGRDPRSLDPALAVLKPAQRKVTATLSKLVLSARAMQYDSGTSAADTPVRIEGDAEELDRALTSFVVEVERYRQQEGAHPTKRLRGVFNTTNIGLGLLGAGAAGSWKGFGWVFLPEEEAPRRVLGPEVAAELGTALRQLDHLFNSLSAALRGPDADSVARVSKAGQFLSAKLNSFVELISTIHIARHVDVDGDHNGPPNPAYLQTVTNAQLFARALETALQSVYDDAASILLAMQSVRDLDIVVSHQERHASYEYLDVLCNSLRANVGVIEQKIQALLALGHHQAELAQGPYHGSIEDRMNRLSVVGGSRRENEPARPISTADGGDVIDMATAFERSVRPKPSFTSDAPSAASSSPRDVITEETLEWQKEYPEEEDVPLTNVRSPPRKNLEGLLGRKIPSTYRDWATINATPWYLRSDVSPTDILTDADGVRGGTVAALVETLTSHDAGDSAFTFNKTFLMTYKTFTTLDELFRLLVERFCIKPPAKMTPKEREDWAKQKQLIIQMRVINTLKMMITDEDILAPEDLYILDKIKDFVTSEEVSGFIAAKQLLNLIERSQRSRGTDVPVKRPSGPPPPSIVPKTSKKLKLLDIDPLELARQLTLLESTLYQNIKPMECLQRAREQKTEHNDSISAVIQTSNRIADWVAESILSKEDSRGRAAALKQFISVADRCRLMHNFSTMVAITSGIFTPPIGRLKRTWEQVQPKFRQQLRTCEATFDSTKNFNNYRKTMATINSSCIPFIGVYLTTLQFIHDGSKDMISEDIVNFRKRQKAVEVIQDIQRWQAQPYNFTPVPSIGVFIQESLNQFNDAVDVREYFWNLSLEREPREREDEKMARLLQESGFL